MVKSLTAVLVACVVMGCSARTQAKASKGGHDKDVIQVRFKADPQLNRFERNPHALLICLYQLEEPDAFKQLAQERDGIPKLLECNRFDPTVVSARQIVLQPGQELHDIRDRGNAARYLGIATGYYSLGKRKVTDLSPLSTNRKGDPSGSLVRIELGPHEIKDVRVE